MPRAPDQEALPRAVACSRGSRAVRATSACRHAAARRQGLRSCASLQKRMRECVRRDALRGRGGASATSCARSRRPRSVRREYATAAVTATSSGALPRRRFHRGAGVMIRSGKLTANQSWLADWELPRRGGAVVAAHAVLPGRALRAGRDPAAARRRRRGAAPKLLRERKGRIVTILVPRRRRSSRLARRMRRPTRVPGAATTRSARRRLRRELPPGCLQRCEPAEGIECVDISTFQGGETVGSIVSFDEAVPTGRHRRFRSGPVVGTDDFASMRGAA